MPTISPVPVQRSEARADAARPAKTTRMVMTPRVRRALADAASQPSGWTYILSATGTPSAPMAVNIQWNDPNRNAQIIVWPLQPNSPNELWMYTTDGYIISSLKSNMCLTVVGDNVLSIPVTSYKDATQLWSLSDNGTVVSQQDNRVLTVGDPIQGGGNFVGVSSLDPSSPPSPSQIWSLYPNNPLAGILRQTQSFPAYTSGDTGTAYSAIMSKLSGGQPDFDLRRQYVNLAAPLSAWLSIVLTMPCPDGVDSGAWIQVQQQLAWESTAAIAVQALFENYTLCHLALFSSQEAILNKAIADASIETSATTSSVFGVIVWGIAYTLLQANPVTAVVANLIQAGINAAAAASPDGVVASNAFLTEVSALWNLLDQGFDEILQATALIENEILSDWGKLQMAYAEIIASQSNFAWATGMTAEIVANSAPGFQVAMLQALVPSKYQIYINAGTWPTPPASCTWQYGDQLLVVASTPFNTDTTYPDYMMINDILADNAVQPELFWLGGGGWATPMAMGGLQLTLMVTNQTTRFFTLYVSQDSTERNTDPVAPWSSGTTSWTLDGTADARVIDSDGNDVVTFQIKLGDDDVPDLSVESLAGGYGVSTPVCNVKFDDSRWDAGPSCQITIFAKAARAEE
jgi:hypothetical protein